MTCDSWSDRLFHASDWRRNALGRAGEELSRPGAQRVFARFLRRELLSSGSTRGVEDINGK